MNAIALLAGLFVPPIYLLVLGHHFRDNSRREKSVFWGTTIGWLAAIVLVTVTLVLDPVLWPESGLRTAIIFWGLLGGAVVGGVLGAVRPIAAKEG